MAGPLVWNVDTFRLCNEDAETLAACETTDWFLGKRGTCNVTTGMCECPEGTNGFDDWASYNDCRVNEGAQLAVWVTSMSIAALAFLVSAYGFLFLLCHWKIVEQPMRRLSGMTGRSTGRSTGGGKPSSRSNSLAEGDSSRGPASPRGSAMESGADGGQELMTPSQQRVARKNARRLKERQRWTFFSLYLFMSYNFSAILYFVGFVTGNFRFDFVWWQDMGASFAASSVFVGMWAFLFIWYKQLPPLRLYGKLFDVDSILIRRPRLIITSVYVRIVGINTVNLLLLIVWPYFVDGSIETRNTLDTLFLYFLALCTLDFIIFALMVSHVLKGLFMQLKRLSDLSKERGVTSGAEKETFDKALGTIVLLRKVVFALGPLVIAVFALAASIRPFRTRIYIGVNFCICVGNLAVLFVVWVFVKRLSGAPVRRRTNPVSPMDSSVVEDELDRQQVASLRL